MRIERNAKIDVNELNNLLKTIGWGLSSSKKLEKSLGLSRSNKGFISLFKW